MEGEREGQGARSTAMTERGRGGKAPATTPTATREARRAVSKNLALRYSYDAHICAWISDYVTIAVPRWMRPRSVRSVPQSWRSSVL